jgi:protein-tyrosine phosphatase
VIDLHCHILPGIDDGAADMDDSVAMARIAAHDGIESVCATPHIRHDHDVRVHGLAERVARLNAELHRASVPLRALRGGELAATSVQGMGDDELGAISLGGGGRWLLLEPGPGPLDDSLECAADELSRRGYRSLIAHPERHLAIDMCQRLARLVGAGALVQVTADTLLDPRTRDAMLELAACGLVHALGSDSHSSRYGRAPLLAAALRVLRDVELVAEHIDWIAEHAPAAIVRGDSIEPPFPTAP